MADGSNRVKRWWVRRPWRPWWSPQWSWKLQSLGRRTVGLVRGQTRSSKVGRRDTISNKNDSGGSRSWKPWQGQTKSWKTVQVFTTLIPEEGEEVLEGCCETMTSTSADRVWTVFQRKKTEMAQGWWWQSDGATPNPNLNPNPTLTQTPTQTLTRTQRPTLTQHQQLSSWSSPSWSVKQLISQPGWAWGWG